MIGGILHGSGGLGGLVARGDVLVLLVAVAVVLAVAGLLSVILLLARRRLQRELREVVFGLEELRSGRTRHRVELETHSPLTLVADAVNRLAQDLHVRLSDSEETRERLQAMMDAVQDSAVITTDLDGDVRNFSAGAVRLLGWEPDDVVARPVEVLFAKGAYETLLPKLTRRASRERGIQTRSMLKRKDGTTFPADVTLRTLHRPSHEPLGFLLVVRDVTRQVRLEQDLRESEARYRSLVEELRDGVVIVQAGRVVFGNPAFRQLCGLSAERLEGSAIRDRVATRDVLLLDESLQRIEATPGAVEALACSLLGPDGQPLADVRILASAIRHEDRPATLLLVRDETASRRVERELRHNEARLDAVIEAASDGILVLADGPEGGIARMTNRAFLRYFELDERIVLGMPERRLLRLLRERGAGHAVVAAFLAAGGETRRTKTIQLGAGTQRELQLSLLPLRDRDGRPFGRVLACRDLTAQRESERKLQQHAEELQLGKVLLERAYRRLDAANRELRQRGEELDRLNRELRSLDEMKTKLLDTVSHELQTPLVSIRGYTEMMLKARLGPITEEQRKGLTLSLRNIDRLISMIDNLLAVSRAEPEPVQLRRTRFPLKTVIEDAAELLREEMEAKALRFTLDLTDDRVEVEADRDKVLQVFINLMSNAVKFTEHDGLIEVAATEGPAGLVRVRVTDTGVGIAESELERIFERGYRVESAPAGARTEGAGLGLAIVREILRAHGCSIDAESSPGRGTTFRFTLPRGDQAAAGGGPGPDDRPGPPSTGAGGAPRSRSAAPPAAAAPPPSDEPAPPRSRFRIIRRERRRDA